jgi:hypothetical protein
VTRAEKELGALKVMLEGRSWGSVHDLFSGPTDGQTLIAHIPTREVLSGAQTSAIAQTLLSNVGASGEWRDHLTQAVFPEDTTTQLIPWAFQRNDWHWLQAGWVC